MSYWKQAIFCLLILVGATLAWLWYFPGESDVLARVGLTRGSSTAEETRVPGAGRRRGGGEAGPVVTVPTVRATINDRLSAIGTGRALRSVIVQSFSSGTLVEIAVASGAQVNAGDVIARLDSDAEGIALDRAVIALDDANARAQRMKALRSSNTATIVQQSEAELAQRNAELAMRDAELALERRSIKAPISGTVGILPISAGSYITSSSEIATIDDRSQILVDFWIPERYADLIEIGSPLSATSVARPDSIHDGTVSAIDNRIDAQSRTLRVEGRVENPDGRLRAGMAFSIAMRFPGDSYPAIDPLAIQWSNDGPYIWAVKDGMARQTPVRIIQRNTDSVLVEADIAEGVHVVTEGIHNVREGAPLQARQTPGPETQTDATRKGPGEGTAS